MTTESAELKAYVKQYFDKKRQLKSC